METIIDVIAKLFFVGFLVFIGILIGVTIKQ
jgi:hypothetical protein